MAQLRSNRRASARRLRRHRLTPEPPGRRPCRGPSPPSNTAGTGRSRARRPRRIAGWGALARFRTDSPKRAARQGTSARPQGSGGPLLAGGPTRRSGEWLGSRSARSQPWPSRVTELASGPLRTTRTLERSPSQYRTPRNPATGETCRVGRRPDLLSGLLRGAPRGWGRAPNGPRPGLLEHRFTAHVAYQARRPRTKGPAPNAVDTTSTMTNTAHPAGRCPQRWSVGGINRD